VLRAHCCLSVNQKPHQSMFAIVKRWNFPVALQVI
jgi:hypothetical protein